MIERSTTKDLFAQSLMELAHTKPLAKISVREIAANCGMTTATFYNHFENKYALMAWINNRDTDAATDLFGYGNDWRQTVALYISALTRYGDFLENALRNIQGFDSFHGNTFEHFRLHAKAHLYQLHGVDRFEDRIEFALDFYFRALSNQLVDWLLKKSAVTADEVAEWCTQDMPDCLKPILDVTGDGE